MGANEIANRIEAAGWLSTTGQNDGEGATDVKASDFYFRSIVGFKNKLEIINPQVGDSWTTVDSISVALFLDRNYARKDTTIQITPIESMRASLNPAGIIPVSYAGMLRVLPLSAQGYESFTHGLVPPLSLPGSLDPYSVIVVVADLDDFQAIGFGVEFSIQVMRLPDLEGGDETAVTFIDAAGP